MKRLRLFPVLLAMAILASAGMAARAEGDIVSHAEALSKAGMCVYPANYVDTLAQGSMAPPRDDAPPMPAKTAKLIARTVTAGSYGGAAGAADDADHRLSRRRLNALIRPRRGAIRFRAVRPATGRTCENR
jgi:hypothetical protein